MVIKSSLAALVAIVGLAGCESKEVAFDTLETARTQAKDNAIWNAQRFRMTDPRFTGQDIIARGDSTQMPDCPQGDGWATMDFWQKENGTMTKVKCSTVSAAVGCMTEADFKNKSYAEEDGHCQSLSKVPFPFRKLTQ
jgi:hypothetical protein